MTQTRAGLLANADVLATLKANLAGGNAFTSGVNTFSDTTASTSSTTGALVVAGGVGIGGKVYAAGDLNTTGSVLADGGIRNRSGLSGSYGGSSCYFNFTGGLVQLWVDATDLGTINLTSDYRIKKDVTDAKSALEEIRRWRPVTYTGAKWGIFEENEVLRHSFIAHELQAVSSDCVIGEKDAEQPQSLDLIPIIARLAKAVQELDAKILAQ